MQVRKEARAGARALVWLRKDVGLRPASRQALPPFNAGPSTSVPHTTWLFLVVYAAGPEDMGSYSAYAGPMRDTLPPLIQSLNYQRSQRLAELQTSYPTIHWVILTLLALSVINNFLIESDNAALQFLNSLRLRVLFTTLIGVFSAVSTLCIDLNDPFRGNFQITPSADQLYVIRETLAEEACAYSEDLKASDSRLDARANEAGYTGRGL